MIDEEKKEVEQVSGEVVENPSSEEKKEETNEPNNEKKAKKPKSKARKIVEWVLTGFFLLIAGFIGAAQIDGMVHAKEHFGQQLKFGYGSFVVTTDSMEPEYPVDIAIITYKESAETIYKRYMNGETVDITFLDGCRENVEPNKTDVLTERTTPVGVVITHRLKDVVVETDESTGNVKYYFFVGGINVSEHYSQIGQYQIVTDEFVLGVVKVKSNAVGQIFKFVSSPWGLITLLLIPAFYLVITSVLDIFKALKEPEEVQADGTAAIKNDQKPSVSSLKDLSDEDIKRLKQEMVDEMLKKKKGGDQ